MLELRVLGGLEVLLDDGARATSVLAQPKRVALLVYLALARPRGFHRRDALLPLFWPEADEQHARRCLNQALHHLRAGLHRSAIVAHGTDEVGLDFGRVHCDVLDLRDAIAAGHLEDAVSRFHGGLLPGFHAQASHEFAEWLDHERRNLRSAVAQAAATLSRQGSDGGDHVAAVHWARRACELEPLDETCEQALLRSLVRAGNDTAARVEFARFAERVGRELEVEPSAQTRACVPADPHLSSPRTSGSAPASEPPIRRSGSRRRHLSALAITAAIIGAVLYAVTTGVRAQGRTANTAGHSTLPTVLIADIVDPDADSLLGDVTTQLFVSALEESRSVRTVWSGELSSALARMQRAPTTPIRGAFARELALHEGYGVVLDGSLRTVSGELLLTVALLNPASGHVLATRSAGIHGANGLAAAVDSIAGSLQRVVGDSVVAPRAVMGRAERPYR